MNHVLEKIKTIETIKTFASIFHPDWESFWWLNVLELKYPLTLSRNPSKSTELY